CLEILEILATRDRPPTTVHYLQVIVHQAQTEFVEMLGKLLVLLGVKIYLVVCLVVLVQVLVLLSRLGAQMLLPILEILVLLLDRILLLGPDPQRKLAQT
ncbi:hypothetical protein EG327_008911, partial [Venturia inaequalis]